MLKRIAARAGRYLLGAAKRFMSNKPSTPYEVIAFSACRSIVMQFARP